MIVDAMMIVDFEDSSTRVKIAVKKIVLEVESSAAA
jgi:hypothetical protein